MNEHSRWMRRMRAGAELARGSMRYFAISVIAVAVFFGTPQPSFAQLPQLQAPSSWGKVPQGTGACSIEKSCADLAPGMIREALGPSPLDQNIRELTGILSWAGDVNARAVSWTEAALRSSGADEVRVERAGPSNSTQIVVAEIRGRELPRDYVLLASPMVQASSAPLATAENVAALVDAVRVIHTSGNIPRRSIRFIFYPASTGSSSEKFSALWAYMRQHRADLDHIAAAVSVDAARGPMDGYSVEGRPQMLPALEETLKPLRSLGIRNFSERVQVQANTTPFWLEGIPTLVATSSSATELTAGASQRGSSTNGSVDAAMLQQLKRGVAVAAVTAYALADAEARIGVRRSPAEVGHSIESLGIKTQLKAAGLWSEWQALQSQENH